MNDLCKQMVQTRELVLNTSGQQFRDFIPLSKVCCAIEWFVSGGKSDSQSGVYNICSNAPESILSMAKNVQNRCLRVLGFQPTLVSEKELDHKILPFV